jgi:hypothetical protein
MRKKIRDSVAVDSVAWTPQRGWQVIDMNDRKKHTSSQSVEAMA